MAKKPSPPLTLKRHYEPDQERCVLALRALLDSLPSASAAKPVAVSVIRSAAS